MQTRLKLFKLQMRLMGNSNPLTRTVKFLFIIRLSDMALTLRGNQPISSMFTAVFFFVFLICWSKLGRVGFRQTLCSQDFGAYLEMLLNALYALQTDSITCQLTSFWLSFPPRFRRLRKSDIFHANNSVPGRITS